MTPDKTALLLIGFQNDYFANDGVLHGVIEESVKANDLLNNTIRVIESTLDQDVMTISTPIVFFDDYRELDNPVGILKTCQELGAFRRSSKGSHTIAPIKEFGDHILELPGKTGLNAFSNTSLLQTLQDNGIEELLIAGVVTSVCIDSTARFASDQGFRVTILSDCTAGRNLFEQDYYCGQIFPIFANVRTHEEILDLEACTA